MTPSETIEALLVEEFGYTPEDARALHKRHTQVVVNGLMASNPPPWRAICMALEMKDAAPGDK